MIKYLIEDECIVIIQRGESLNLLKLASNQILPKLKEFYLVNLMKNKSNRWF
jgi:hypothetical protein